MGQDFLVDLKLNLGSEYSGYEILGRRKKKPTRGKDEQVQKQNVGTSKSC